MARVKQPRRTYDILRQSRNAGAQRTPPRPHEDRNADAQRAASPPHQDRSADAQRTPSPPHQGRNAADASGRRPFARRVWSLADEVRILEGLAAYVANHGKPPGRSDLHDALKDRAMDKAQYTVTEIYEKVRSLRGRYFTMRGAGGPTGDDATEAQKYQLSSHIWGDEEAPRSAQAKLAKKLESERREFEQMHRLYPYLSTTVEGLAGGENSCAPVFKRALEHMDDEAAVELEGRMKKQRMKATKLSFDRNMLKNQVFEALLKAME